MIVYYIQDLIASTKRYDLDDFEEVLSNIVMSIIVCYCDSYVVFYNAIA